MMTINYEILGKEIILSNGESDGYETVGDFDYEVDVKPIDLMVYFDLPLTKSVDKAVKTLMDCDMFDDTIENDSDFYDFMKDRYESEAREEHDNEE